MICNLKTEKNYYLFLFPISSVSNRQLWQQFRVNKALKKRLLTEALFKRRFCDQDYIPYRRLIMPISLI